MFSKGVLPSEVDDQDPDDLMYALAASIKLLPDAEEEKEERTKTEGDYYNLPPMFWPE